MVASMEVMLDLWSAALREGKARMQLLFKHPSVAESAASYIDGLLGPERRKTGWMRAEAAGDAGDPGASRRCSAGRSGRRTRFVMWCATVLSRRWVRPMP